VSAPQIGTLTWLSAIEHADLLAAPVAAAIADLRLNCSVAAIDPDLADTAAFCAAYDVPPEVSANCVVVAGRCDMGRSAVRAARNFNAAYGVPFGRIELTPMIGINDVTANVFTLDDAATLARFVRAERLAGVHFWSLDRDGSCVNDAAVVSSTCSGLRGLSPLAFTRALRGARAQ